MDNDFEQKIKKRQRDIDHHSRLIGQVARSFAANTLRVCAGAGSPPQMVEHAIELLQAVNAMQEAVGRYPYGNIIGSALDMSDFESRMQLDPENREWRDAQDEVIAGAMRVYGSKLMEQKTQESHAQTKMFDGLREIERLREIRRKRYA